MTSKFIKFSARFALIAAAGFLLSGCFAAAPLPPIGLFQKPKLTCANTADGKPAPNGECYAHKPIGR